MYRHLLALLAATMLGCASQPAPTAADSVIVFVLPGMTSTLGQYQPTYGATPSVSLHDVSNPANRKTVGILGIGQKLGYRVSPGKHEFMLVNKGSTDFLEANVGAGKTYYAIVQLQAQTSYDQKYGFRPVRPIDFENGFFARWDANTSVVDRPDAWQRWGRANAGSVDARLQEYRPAWDKQGAAERRLRTLQVSDGR